MSENVLRLIPAEPTFVPAEQARQQVFDLLDAVAPHGTEVTMRVTDEVEFVDQGQLFDHVSCPACGARYADSATSHGWWHEAMDKAYEERFRNLLVTMPCCGERTSLDKLNYITPAGFARFVVQLQPQWGNGWSKSSSTHSNGFSAAS
jgi:hypothetical protein